MGLSVSVAAVSTVPAMSVPAPVAQVTPLTTATSEGIATRRDAPDHDRGQVVDVVA